MLYIVLQCRSGRHWRLLGCSRTNLLLTGGRLTACARLGPSRVQCTTATRLSTMTMRPQESASTFKAANHCWAWPSCSCFYSSMFFLFIIISVLNIWFQIKANRHRQHISDHRQPTAPSSDRWNTEQLRYLMSDCFINEEQFNINELLVLVRSLRLLLARRLHVPTPCFPIPSRFACFLYLLHDHTSTKEKRTHLHSGSTMIEEQSSR